MLKHNRAIFLSPLTSAHLKKGNLTFWLPLVFSTCLRLVQSELCSSTNKKKFLNTQHRKKYLHFSFTKIIFRDAQETHTKVRLSKGDKQTKKYSSRKDKPQKITNFSLSKLSTFVFKTLARSKNVKISVVM